jgi:drug/metabolite transporter (DMT)-like permease
MTHDRRRSKTRIFTAIVILSNALGNFALARGMRGRATSSAMDYLAAIFAPWVMLGISLLILWLLSRMALLSWADLSYVLPVTSLGYVASAFIGRFFLDEKITPDRWAGTLLIVAGTVLVGLGVPHSNVPDSGLPDSKAARSDVPDSDLPHCNIPHCNVPHCNVTHRNDDALHSKGDL